MKNRMKSRVLTWRLRYSDIRIDRAIRLGRKAEARKWSANSHRLIDQLFPRFMP